MTTNCLCRDAFLVAITCALLLIAPNASAATRYVAVCGDDTWSGTLEPCDAPDGPKATVQAAIDASVDGDVVVVLDGTYRGAGNTEITFGGRSLLVRSANGAEFTTIDGEFAARAFDFHQGETLDAVIEGFTVVNGSAIGGGAVRVKGGAATIRACVFTGNTSPDSRFSGGALWVSDGSVRVFDTTFDSNISVLRHGGAAHVTSYSGPADGRFERCVFRGNQAPTLTGGAISCLKEPDMGPSEVVVVECVFEDNHAAEGGGIAFGEGGGSVLASTFHGNTAAVSGGGIQVNLAPVQLTACSFTANQSASGGGLALWTPAAVDACVFEGNEADRGGAIWILGAAPSLTNCVAVGNHAESGGAIFNGEQGSPVIVGCTLVNNTATAGGAMATSADVLPARPFVMNSISWGNTPDEFIERGLGATFVSRSDVQGGWAGSGFDNIDADPLFNAPANNDWRIGAGSPCIDAGNNGVVPDGIKADFGGRPRFVDDPATVDTGVGAPPIVDMGAYEFQGGICVEDLDASGAVDTVDLVALLLAWGPCRGCPEDFDGNGAVTFADLLALIRQWGPCVMP